MADKIRKLYALAAKFAHGELPSAAKMTGISTQAKNSIDVLEYIVGDLWNAAGDPVLSPAGNITRQALHIPNLARAIGRLSGLNTMIPGELGSSMIYVDDLGSRYAGQTQGFLTWKPRVAPSSGTISLTGTVAPIVQGDFKTSPSLLSGAGDWTVDVNGKFCSVAPIPAGLVIEYAPRAITDTSEIDGAEYAGSWNVIPDPTTWTGAYAGLKVSFANGVDNSTGYHIWLPPRKPMTGDRLLSKSYSSSAANVTATPDSGTTRAYQSTAVDAALTRGDQYRYVLPFELFGVAANTMYPSGFMYIWDQQTGTIVEGGTYFMPANTAHGRWKIRVTGPDLANVFGTTVGNGIITSDSTQLPGDYFPRFKLITVGNSLAKVVTNLNRSFWNHSHKNAQGGKPVSHADLDHLVTPSAGTNYPTNVPTFLGSRWVNDDHLQYLHRGGSTATGDTTKKRDTFDNAIFNTLVISDFDQTNYLMLDMGVLTSNAAIIKPSTGTQFAMTNASGSAFIGFNSPININEIQILAPDGVLLGSPKAEKYYFTNTAGAAYEGNYLTFESAEFKFITAVGFSIITGGVFQGSEQIISLKDVAAAGDPAGVRTGSFQYTAPRLQHIHVTPLNVNLYGYADMLLAPDFVTNLSSSTTKVVYAPVNFPHGARLTTADMIPRFWLTSNGVGNMKVELHARTKPTASGYSVWATTLLLTATCSPATSQVIDQVYAVDHTVDTSSLTGNIYAIRIEFPVAIGSAFPSFWGANFPYFMDFVDN